MLIHGVVDYAIFMLDPDGHVATWNPGAERIKGYTADEIIGQHFSRSTPRRTAAAGVPDRALRTGRARRAGSQPRAGACARTAAGSGRWWSSTPSAQEGELVGFAKITRDMTEQRRSQLACARDASGGSGCWSRA